MRLGHNGLINSGNVQSCPDLPPRAERYLNAISVTCPDFPAGRFLYEKQQTTNKKNSHWVA